MTIQTLTSFVKVRGTAAQRTAFNLSDIPQYQEIEFFETDTDATYLGSRDGWVQTGASGAALVSPRPGTGKPTKNRYIHPDATSAEATNRALFQVYENVTCFWVTPKPDADIVGTASTVYPEEKVKMVVDAVDYASGVSLLGFAGGAGLDSQIIPLEYGIRNGPFYCTGYLSALDFAVPANSEVYVEAQ